MATLTIRNVPEKVVRLLKQRARRSGHSMEQEVRSILERQAADRDEVLKRIEASWKRQLRVPTATEVNSWLERGRDG